MGTTRCLLLICLIKLIYLVNNINCNEVLGCGGFIKSHADIDFSKVEIKLLTKQGSLKDKTDCSPSNGYYFLPIYDKGSYLLSISPPPGWSFEPQQVELDFDGKSDVCSQGKDVNFVFKGFGITGKVSLSGYGNVGARGVSVHLKSKDNSEVRQSTTDVNGVFSFTPIIPGKYVITASHSKWHFSKAEHTVIVDSGNTELPENSLVVSGFDVTGHIDSNSQINSVIGLAIFKEKGQMLPSKCSKSNSVSLSSSNSNYDAESICYSKINNSGEYKFEGVAPGKYILEPVIEKSNLKLHITPNFIEFQVLKDTLEIKDKFKITGFSITGKVLSSEGGSPISGAVVKLNGQRITETGSDGSYILENIKSATYTLQVDAPKMKFDEMQVNIQMSTPVLPDIVASLFEVCGKVVSKKSFVVGITKQGSTFHTTSTSKPETGEWCAYLPKGKFNIEVLTTEADKSSGVQFFPVQQHIEVKSTPSSGIVFSQLRANLNGELKCLPDAPITCTEAEVTLHSLDSLGQPTGQKQRIKARKGQYKFTDILPGPYELTIPQSNMCFDSTRILINVASTAETASPFIQRGYEVSIISSHRAIVKYNHVTVGTTTQSQAPTTNTLKLLSGVNTFCVPQFGTYNMKLEGCHLYDDNLPKSFTTNDTPIVITAIAHKVGIRVLSTESTADALQLEIQSQSLDKQLIRPIPESHKVDDKLAYRYDTHLKPGEIIHIEPKSDILLITPQSKEIVGTNDCIDIAFNFIATRGLILRGKVVPAIKDVKISLNFPNNPELSIQTVQTSITGEFKFGPIDENLVYDLTAEKESYVFSAYKRDSNSFSAHKLCEIIVKVKDEANNGLSGVLLSLSGAESYRKNLVTGNDGSINFHSLSPSQYFLRPMMKEYKFEPISKMIDIKDGETIEVELVGKRVAFSVFGKIMSLNGDPYGQVEIEAEADENCMHHQEEAISEVNGQYRLRGLQPGCTYTIRPKEGSNMNSNVERSIPPTRTVKIANEDVRDVNMIAISTTNFVDVTARVMTTSNDHYKTLRIVMYRKGDSERKGTSDSPVFSQRLETPLNPKLKYNPGIMVFFPRMPLDNKSYVVELKSTLSDKTYTYVEPSMQFVANTSSIYVELNFKPEVRAAETELSQNSISALLLVALVAIAFFKQDLAMDFLNFTWSKASTAIKDIAQKQINPTKKDLRKPEPINQKEIDHLVEQINASKKKKAKKI